jgi:hypothetical protein
VQVTADDGTITQRFRLALTSAFGLRMLKQLGTEQCFMDAAYGLTSLGFPQTTLVVRDEFGNGVPVAVCISDNEEAFVFEEFLRALAAVRAGLRCGRGGRAHHLQTPAATSAYWPPSLPRMRHEPLLLLAPPPHLRPLPPQAIGAPFKFGLIMIDKSKAEIKAIASLRQAGLADGHLLCKFHMLQGEG